MLKKLALATILLLQVAASPAIAEELMEGQIWRYQTRQGEEASRLFIARIEHGLSSQPIYHIYLEGLKWRNPLMAGGVEGTVPFAQVAREALEASVTGLTGAGERGVGEGGGAA